MADEGDEEETEKALEEEVDTISLEAAKRKIIALKSEQERKKTYQLKLDNHMQKLDQELSAVRGEVESLQRTLQLEKMKNEEERTSREREMSSKRRLEEDRVRDYLSEVLYTKPPSKGSKTGSYDLDTVLISFVKPNEAIRYNLTFRVDSTTTIKQLLTDACKYWAVSPEEYILKTMANSKCQNEIKVKDCFKQGEIAQLRLENVMRDNVLVSEAETKAIQPKQKTRRHKQKNFNAEGVDAISKFNDGYMQDLQAMPGIFMLLRLKDQKPSEHHLKIKLRDFVFYTLLAVLTFYTYNQRRPAQEEFWVTRGVEDAFMARILDSRRTAASGMPMYHPTFSEVNTQEEVWDWMTNVLPAVVWAPGNNTFGTHNKLLGYLSIRVQNVKTPVVPWNSCPEDFRPAIEKLGTAVCYPLAVTEETQEDKRNIPLARYWQFVLDRDMNKVQIRGAMSDPSVWRSDEQNAAEPKLIQPLFGTVKPHFPSGYSVDYRMTVEVDQARYYTEDMLEFRRLQWISLATRVVVVSLTTYNFHYDMWTSSDFMFEMVPSGFVQPTMVIRPFRPNAMETSEELAWSYMDYVRTLIAFYILIFVGIEERKHKYKNTKGGYWYCISLNGICDHAIVGCTLAAVIIRQVHLSMKTIDYLAQIEDLNPAQSTGFISSQLIAEYYMGTFFVEGLLFNFSMYRLITLFRLHHSIYMLWRMIGLALRSFWYFVGLFAPMIVGFWLLSHSVYGAFLDEFSTLSSALLSVHALIYGNMDFRPMFQRDPVWTIVYFVLFYIIVGFVLLNVFSTIMVDAYYTVRLTTLRSTERWNAKKLQQWAVPTPINQIASSLMSTSQEGT